MSEKEINNTEKDSHNALEIINDPKYRISAEQQEQDSARKGLSRRDLLKYSGATAAALSVAGAAKTGFETARSGDAYTGFGRTYMGDEQFFNREPFRAETAAMTEQVGPVERVDWHDYLLHRWTATMGLIASKKWTPAAGVETMPGHLGEYYRKNPVAYDYVLKKIDVIAARNKWLNNGGYDQIALFEAYKNSHIATNKTFLGQNTIPENPQDVFKATGEIQPPEKWDFRYIKKNRKKLEFKSPRHASELIKTMAHRFGAPIVAITKFDERFMYKNVMRGYPDQGIKYGDKVPEHWKSMIVFGMPMEWDKMHSSASFGNAQDGYVRVRLVAALLERFIQEIGYPSRAQTPAATYEVIMTPFVLTSGLGEFSRAGYAMVPEVGANFRPAGVITDIDFEYDKPINIGMAKFCMKCKICADTCPTGAIESGDEPKGLVRGVKRWDLDREKCHLGWLSTASGTCSSCMAVCPFTRKNTWIHAISRELDARDVTGLVGEGLLAMQLNFFKYPTGEEFLGEHAGGKGAVYHNPPMWQRTEEWFSNVVQTWEYDGMH